MRSLLFLIILQIKIKERLILLKNLKTGLVNPWEQQHSYLQEKCT